MKLDFSKLIKKKKKKKIRPVGAELFRAGRHNEANSRSKSLHERL